MIFQNPELLLLLIVIPVYAALRYYYYKKRLVKYVSYSDISDIISLPGNILSKSLWVNFSFQGIALVLIVISLARPIKIDQTINRSAEGIDIILVLDLSTSMLAEDLQPNRFIASKNVAFDFVSRRPNDRIGLVVFALKSLTLIPPTLDHRLVKSQIEDLSLEVVKTGILPDGTAIGMGLATAVNRLRYSDAASKVIILLTDGENNAGEIDPITAADLAATNGIRVYTIGASTEGTAPYPVDNPVSGRTYFPIKVEIDEPMLTEIAVKTGGRYFRARDTKSLFNIYQEIDRLETSDIDELIYIDKKDVYQTFLLTGIFLILFSMFFERVFIKV